MSGPLDSDDECDAREWERHMRRGDFPAAWRVSDRILARTRCFGNPTQPRHFQQIWNGTPFDGRHVLVRCYHGLGDTIQFARYLPGLAKRARSVTVWAQPLLLPLLDTCRHDMTLIPLHDGAVNVDYEVDVELMELPFAFRTTLATIPAADYADMRAFGEPSGRGLRVGIAWRGGDWNPQRSVPFHQLAPLFELPGIEWLSLQYGARADEQHPHLAAFAADTVSIMPTAARICGCDVVISIDSMIAHLAGTLGVRTWTLLPRAADWRWLERRCDSPWYPTMRLFRNQREDQWRDTVACVRSALIALLEKPPVSSF